MDFFPIASSPRCLPQNGVYAPGVFGAMQDSEPMFFSSDGSRPRSHHEETDRTDTPQNRRY